MLDLIGRFFDMEPMAPHGMCLLWRPELIWTHVISDALIGAAYFSIPVALGVFVVKRKDIEFGWIFWCFALFIIACGVTHFFSIWTLWNPAYATEAVIKIITAGISVVTAILLWPLIPQTLALPSPSQLTQANAELQARIRERDEAIVALREALDERAKIERELQQAQKMDALGQLTGGVAHDFNNLLMAISANLEILKKRLVGNDIARRLADNAAMAADRGAALTRRMLAFARKQELKPVPVEIDALVSTTRDLLQVSIGPTTEIVMDVPPGLPSAMVDVHQLELAIVNLALNARDASPEGSPIVIQASEESEPPEGCSLPPGSYLRISVSDRGEGMDEETLARAVEPFFTTKPVGKGTGLGLPMVDGFMRQSGGALRLRSQKGLGTTAELWLPVIAKPDREYLRKDADRPRVPARPLSVLVVDDDAMVLSAMTSMLEDLGHLPEAVTSGQDALAKLGAESGYDLVITDHAMAGMTGVQLANRIRKLNPKLPILLVTGYAELGAKAKDLRVLPKPFQQNELTAALAALFHEAQASVAEPERKPVG